MQGQREKGVGRIYENYSMRVKGRRKLSSLSREASQDRLQTGVCQLCTPGEFSDY